MSHTMTYDDAKREVERKLGFFTHLATYVIVNSGLLTLNLLSSPGHLWALWPLMGWGIGLLSHATRVFLHAPTSDWKKHMIARELAKHNHPPAA